MRDANQPRSYRLGAETTTALNRMVASGRAENRSAAIRTAVRAFESEGEVDLKCRAFGEYLRTGRKAYERRDQSASVDTAGGFVTMPGILFDGFLTALDDLLPLREGARRLPPVPANATLDVPFIDDSGFDGGWQSELSNATDSDLAFGGRVLKPSYLSFRTVVSRALLQGPRGAQAESFILDRLAQRAAEYMERGYTVGTGVGEPLGIFTPTAAGVPDTQDVTSAASDLAWNDLVAVKGGLKSQYARRAVWIMHRTVWSKVAEIADDQKRPIYDGGEVLMGRPVILSEYAPEFAAGGYALAFGDLESYWTLDADRFDLLRAEEGLARSNAIEFFARFKSDGAPMIGEGFARLVVKS